jgi:hypothetical protein
VPSWTILTSVEPGPHTIVCSGIDLRGDPAVLGIDVQILAVVGGGGGAAFTGTVLNVPLWMRSSPHCSPQVWWWSRWAAVAGEASGQAPSGRLTSPAPRGPGDDPSI